MAGFFCFLCISISTAQSVPESKTDQESTLPKQLQDKLPIPDHASLVQARKLFDDVFKEEYENAKETADLQSLAKVILQKGIDSKDGPATQFVLLCQARDIAARACDGPLAFKAVDELDRIFAIDAMAMKGESLKQLSKAARTPDSRKAVVEQSLEVSKEAYSSEKFAVADDIVKFMASEAAKLKDKNLIQKVQTCRKNLDNARKACAQMETAKGTLKDNPDDPDANLAVGRYLCFIKDNWEEGLDYLAKGNNKYLKKLAVEEMNNPAETDAQVALADGWWEQAQLEQDYSRKTILQHAGQWYENTLPKISGMMKLKVEKRLDQIKELDIVKKNTEINAIASETTRLTGKEIPKKIDSELRLDRAHGPYKVVDVVVVTPTGKLFLERGTTVLCAPGAKLVVEGDIGSYGEGDQFVMFRRGFQDRSWNTIAFAQKDKNIVLERFDIRGAECGLDMYKGPVEVKNCIFIQNIYGVKISNVGKLINCLIVNNIKDGIQFNRGLLNVDHCNINNNGEVGVHTTYDGSALIKDSMVSGNAIGIQSNLYVEEVGVHSCNFTGNKLAIEVKTKQEFKCENNYWGTVNKQQIIASFVDGRTKPEVGAVIYEPFEKKSVLDAGCTLKMVR
jgi:hypothetical protein